MTLPVRPLHLAAHTSLLGLNAGLRPVPRVRAVPDEGEATERWPLVGFLFEVGQVSEARIVQSSRVEGADSSDGRGQADGSVTAHTDRGRFPMLKVRAYRLFTTLALLAVAIEASTAGWKWG
jgi:hypothetical protein